MNVRADLERLVSDWLQADATSAGSDRVLAAALVRVGAAGQAVDGPTWRLRGVGGYPKVALAATAVIVVAAVGIVLLPSFGGLGASPTATPSTAPSPAATAAQHAASAIPPGSSTIRSERALVHLTVPAGWSWSPDGTSICKVVGESSCPAGWGVTIGVHDVAQVVSDVCSWARDVPHQHFDHVGPSADNLTTALVNQVGTRVLGPEDVMVGGYPARKLVITLPQDLCPRGPEGRGLWEDVRGLGSGFGVLKGGTATVYIVEVDGQRLVITSGYRGAAAEDIAQLDAIIASIKIDAPLEYVVSGQNSLTVSGVPFSFTADGSWERNDRISLTRSIAGPQGAEAMVFWTGFPDGDDAVPCGALLTLPDDATAADLAAAISTAPGTELVSGVSDVQVGGRPATHVVVTIREDLGCDPGYFFSWSPRTGGAVWTDAGAGDTIRAWVVDVDGTTLVIAGATRARAVDWAPMTEVQRTLLEEQIQQIVDSIRFE